VSGLDVSRFPTRARGRSFEDFSVGQAYRAAEETGAGAAGMVGSLIDAAALRIMDAVIQKAELIERTTRAAAQGPTH
jgi:hypothetical protein